MEVVFVVATGCLVAAAGTGCLVVTTADDVADGLAVDGLPGGIAGFFSTTGLVVAAAVGLAAAAVGFVAAVEGVVL